MTAAAPDEAPKLWIGTFHAFGLDLIRRYHDKFDLPPDPPLFDRSDAIEVLEEVLPTLPLLHYRNLWDPALVLRDIVGAISRAKDELVDAKAQFDLGGMYAQGRGVPRDYTEEAKWLRKAAEQGLSLAQFDLGVMYAKGKGLPQDYAEAVKWYRKAAEQENAYAQHNLGTLYREGQGVPQDYAEAAKWYHKSADQGAAKAQFNLGVMYATGEGMPQDRAEAAKWYRKAAE